MDDIFVKADKIIDGAKEKMSSAVKFFEEDLKTYRVGKANPMIFNNICVDYYGTMTPLPQVSSITAPDAKTLMIQPWDKKMIPPIEKAIMDANVGLTPQNNGETIRCIVPPLTEDRRKELIKKMKATGETTKVNIRNARRDAIDALKKAQKDGLPEDVEKDYEQKAQKETDNFTKKVEELCTVKEKEILTV
ncbi:MAG: ribosome recycling factor [Bacteroidales bacterium]|nr:ribosome recycling factor [Bacteroidales bacterium]